LVLLGGGGAVGVLGAVGGGEVWTNVRAEGGL
jgi:hypothetical protein